MSPLALAALAGVLCTLPAAYALELKPPGGAVPPKVREAVKQSHTLSPAAKKALAAAYIQRANLSIYAEPFEAWCRENSSGSTEGRVHLAVRFLRRPDGTLLPAYLVVNTGAGEQRQPVSLGAGSFNISSNILVFQAREICSDRCVTVRLEPRNRADAPRINSSMRRACITRTP